MTNIYTSPYTPPAKRDSASESRKSRLKLRIDVIRNLSDGKMCCACCGENHIEFLTIDHIGGTGAEHKKSLGLPKHGGNSSIYRDIRDQGYPTDKFRVLCWNCNCAIGTYGFCPHEKEGILLHPHFSVKKLREDAGLPFRSNPEDAGWDVYTLDEITLSPHSFTDIHTGIAMAIDNPNYWAELTGRSSTVRKWKLQVQIGVIDSGYTGELFIGVWNLLDEPVCVPAKTRLGQILFHINVSPEWVEVKELPKTIRGSDGYGSTGV